MRRTSRALLAVLPVTLLVATTATARPAGAATSCTQDWRPASPAAYLDPDATPTDPPRWLPPAPGPGYRAFHVFCGGHYVNTVWVAPVQTPSTVATLGRDVVAGARYPTVRPGANPGLGITGLATWFWATADDTPVRMLAGNGPSIDVELRITTVRWRFGDGTTGTVSGWGAPYPSESPVRHVFERTGTFTIEARVVLVGRVRGEELDVELPGGHSVTVRHDVAEIRSLLHAG